MPRNAEALRSSAPALRVLCVLTAAKAPRRCLPGSSRRRVFAVPVLSGVRIDSMAKAPPPRARDGSDIVSVVVGTAGHIDHGKSTLVKTLTGIDPDRLKEEQERGLTIDIGFARFDLPDGRTVGIVDVPGHERFVKNMVAGATGVDVVVLVVAADDGIMPQTREHLDILTLLGIEHGLVAVTKIDMVDQDLLDVVLLELQDLLRGTFLEKAPV